jgi:hypothetical protein
VGQTQHIIRDVTGAIIETHIYRPGPFPPRSPIKTVRPGLSGRAQLGPLAALAMLRCMPPKTIPWKGLIDHQYR